MSKSYISPQLRQKVREQSLHRCSYCQSQQKVIGISLTVDHIIPESLGGSTTLDNLCMACWDCNLFKSNQVTAADPQTALVIRLFHPNQQEWSDHFSWNPDGTQVIGLTPTGRATIIALQLNRSTLLTSRVFWVEAGWHPPSE